MSETLTIEMLLEEERRIVREIPRDLPVPMFHQFIKVVYLADIESGLDQAQIVELNSYKLVLALAKKHLSDSPDRSDRDRFIKELYQIAYDISSGKRSLLS